MQVNSITGNVFSYARHNDIIFLHSVNCDSQRISFLKMDEIRGDNVRVCEGVISAQCEIRAGLVLNLNHARRTHFVSPVPVLVHI